MHLQQHGRVQPSRAEGWRYADHRAFDNIGGTALDWRVDRLAFGKTTHGLISAVKAGNMNAAPKQRFDIAILACR